MLFFFSRSNAAGATGLGLFTLRQGDSVLFMLRLFPKGMSPHPGGTSELSGKAGSWTSGDQMRSPKTRGGRLEKPRLTKKYLGLAPGVYRRGGTDGDSTSRRRQRRKQGKTRPC
ncbi:hypothetical protein CGRA01v4_02371 [Colletotrichum graminicola]|nr:hypothetical protein CGRA01v4_02371 [Colletotrichum graminicola]